MLCIPAKSVIKVNIWDANESWKNQMLVELMPFKIAFLNAFVAKHAGTDTATLGEHGYVVRSAKFLTIVDTHLGIEG